MTPLPAQPQLPLVFSQNLPATPWWSRALRAVPRGITRLRFPAAVGGTVGAAGAGGALTGTILPAAAIAATAYLGQGTARAGYNLLKQAAAPGPMPGYPSDWIDQWWNESKGYWKAPFGGRVSEGIREFWSGPQPPNVTTPMNPGEYYSATNRRQTPQPTPYPEDQPGAEVPGGTGGSDPYAAARAAQQRMLAQALAMLQSQLQQGTQIIGDVSSSAAASARAEAERLQGEYGPSRAASVEEMFLNSADQIAAREAEIAQYAANPEGAAGVYVAPGGTKDWEMMMRAAAPREAALATNLTNVTADSARMMALEAEQLGVSYTGALVNLVTMLGAQLQMQNMQTLAGYDAASAQAASAANVGRTAEQELQVAGLFQDLRNKTIDPQSFRNILSAPPLSLSPEQIDWYIINAQQLGPVINLAEQP